MTEIKRVYQHRRDFQAVYECESCKATETISGYDDTNYHMNVVPNIKCKVCDNSTQSLALNPVDNTIVPSYVVI